MNAARAKRHCHGGRGSGRQQEEQRPSRSPMPEEEARYQENVGGGALAGREHQPNIVPTSSSTLNPVIKLKALLTTSIRNEGKSTMSCPSELRWNTVSYRRKPTWSAATWAASLLAVTL
jgi:hypothetical protein